MTDSETLVVSREVRDRNLDRVDVLDKVKALVLLPDGRHATTDLVAQYFEVEVKTLESVILRNRSELESNGYQVVTRDAFETFTLQVSNLSPHTRRLALFDRRSILNVAMLLRDSEVARKIRQYLLDAESAARKSVQPAGLDIGSLDITDPHLAIKLAQMVQHHATIAIEERRQRELAEAQVVELEPRAAQADHQRKAEGEHPIATFCADLQLWAKENHQVKLLHNDVRDFLGDLKLVIRHGPRRNEPYTEATKAGYVRLSKGVFDTNHHGSFETAATRLTEKGWGYAWDRAIRRLADHGSLESSKSIAISD